MQDEIWRIGYYIYNSYISLSSLNALTKVEGVIKLQEQLKGLTPKRKLDTFNDIQAFPHIHIF